MGIAKEDFLSLGSDHKARIEEEKTQRGLIAQPPSWRPSLILKTERLHEATIHGYSSREVKLIVNTRLKFTDSTWAIIMSGRLIDMKDLARRWGYELPNQADWAYKWRPGRTPVESAGRLLDFSKMAEVLDTRYGFMTIWDFIHEYSGA